MKRIIFIVLTVILALFCFVGCEDDDVIEPVPPTEVNLIDELSEYLSLVNSAINYADLLSLKVNNIINGAEPIHVGFDETCERYYVCAYYNIEHYNEGWNYCCAKEYTWIEYKSESEIKEYYGEEKFLVGFQLDRAKFATNILTGKASAKSFEDFRIYEPVFEGGVNVAPKMTINKTYIYIDTNNNANLYHDSSFVTHTAGNFNCVYLDGKYYIISYRISDHLYENIDVYFGQLSDELLEIMVTDKLSMTWADGTVSYYGLFEIGEFADVILK